VRKDVAREVVELVFGERNFAHRVTDTSIEVGRFAKSAQRNPPPGVVDI
jgi:hypothetical protein